MASNRDYYEVLGIDRKATDKEVRSAYRRLARAHHPDVNPGDASAEERFKELNEAYQVLSDPASRKAYDRYGANWRHASQYERAGAPGGPSPFTWFQGARSQRRGGKGGFGSLGDLFGDLFTGGRETPQAEAAVTVSLEEAATGATRLISLDGRRLEVKIPPGVDTGSRVRIAPPGAPELHLVVTVSPHPRFERRGDDLTVSVDTPLIAAVLGGEAEVPLLSGKRLALKIPAGTQNGRTFRLRGKGMPQRGGTGHGDLLASVRVVLPEHLTDEQRALFERLRETETEAG
jgi:curved DNA-binding protein